mmetsp:Transcript_16678/g.37552  ORF Transcript_16678/g.37552 Transcript_16678/m.37552 type:complete len:217 (-) Transcript_16678:61-711(-)
MIGPQSQGDQLCMQSHCLGQPMRIPDAKDVPTCSFWNERAKRDSVMSTLSAASTALAVSQEEAEEEEDDDDGLTLMVKNLPVCASRDTVAEFLIAMGFRDEFNFLYLPVKMCTMVPISYCFVNFVTREAGERFMDLFSEPLRAPPPHLETFRFVTWAWASSHQGLAANVERYRNSPVMHSSVPDDCKPAVYRCGDRVAFPCPTTRLRAPRVRKEKT